ncbi:MAG: S4 domain-containing protein [Pseudomonadota bacterium]
MRLSKFLSLCVAMSRNQAKYFVRRGRIAVDGTVVIDPEFDVADGSRVTFDGKPMSIAGFEYIVLHKPLAFGCTTRDTAHPSVLALLEDRAGDRYYYYANLLGPEVTGLVLLSDDARWTQRIKRRLEKKPRVYLATTSRPVEPDQLEALRARVGSDTQHGDSPVLDVRGQGDTTLAVTMRQASVNCIEALLAGVGLSLDRLHLQQLGRLGLGDLREGAYRVCGETDIRI